MPEEREPGGGRVRAMHARPVEIRPSPASEPASVLEGKFWPAMAIYALLAMLAWFTMGPGKVDVAGKPVEMRWIPLLVLGGLALRTMMARHAEKIRGAGEKDGQ
jgi:hypothetical protein